tara:strand:+ start:53691 stop:54923 length:1233 start_codon:yes stop_codon:yes gene_type:complete
MSRPLLLLLLGVVMAWGQPAKPRFHQPPHNYWQRVPRDAFTQFAARIKAGQVRLDHSNEKAFMNSLLRALDISPASQILVFSTTSLQLSRISVRNPRALYFNDHTYVGYVPGGQIEVISIDPDMGGVFHIFDIPRTAAPINIQRSTRCMNCHAGQELGRVPGLLIKSVVSGPNGGSLDAFRTKDTGHNVPYKERFGGWHVTGEHAIKEHWGNLHGQLVAGDLKKIPAPPGRYFDWAKYPVPTSDILPHLIHEHQAGFVNRAVKATYDTRYFLAAGKGRLSAEHAAEVNRLAELLTRYILFADEPPLPPGGMVGDPAFKQQFRRRARLGPGGQSLRDWDLRTRLFKHRCSYMIHAPSFAGLPPVLKAAVLARMRRALDTTRLDPVFAHRPVAEKQAIQAILKATLPGWSGG